MNVQRSIPPPPVIPNPVPAPPMYYAETQLESGPFQRLNPLRLLRIAYKKWLTILLTVLFVLGAAIFYLSRAPRLYQAWAMIELSVRRPRILNKQDAMIEDPTMAMQVEETLNTQIEKFKSEVMQPHVRACYRTLYPNDPIGDEELARRLTGRANFSLMRHTRLVRVSYMSRDPEFAIRA